MNNLFIGSYLPVLSVLYKESRELSVVIEKKNINSEITEFCKNNKINYHFVELESDIDTWIDNKSFDNVIVASFGLILSSKFLKKCKNVFNFHPGDVHSCRGRHPLPAAIKRGDKKIAVSVHEIDSEEIDRGRLFAQYFVALDYESSYQENYDRLLNSLTFLAEQLCSYLSNNKRPPLWEWEPNENSYLSKLEKNELEHLMSLRKAKDF